MFDKELDHFRKNICRALDISEAVWAEGYPYRDEPIGADDIINLRIALNVAQDLDEFLSLV